MHIHTRTHTHAHARARACAHLCRQHTQAANCNPCTRPCHVQAFFKTQDGPWERKLGSPLLLTSCTLSTLQASPQFSCAAETVGAHLVCMLVCGVCCVRAHFVCMLCAVCVVRVRARVISVQGYSTVKPALLAGSARKGGLQAGACR